MKKRFGNKALIFILTFMLLTVATVLVVIANNSTVYQYADFTFTVNADGTTATITGVNLTERTSEFRIPYTVTDKNDSSKKYTVTAIKDNAFSSDSVRKNVFGKVTIASTVKEIGSGAFSGTYITGIVDLSKVTSIGSSAFKNCDGITEVILSDSITEIKESTFNDCFALSKVNTENIVTFGKQCFYNCRALYDITLGENARTINSYAFSNCDSLDGIIDNSMLTKIDSDAYAGCDKIEGFIIPDYLTLTSGSSGKKYFSPYEKDVYSNKYSQKPKEYKKEACFSLKGFYTLDSNPNYTSVDGVIYSKDGSKIIKYPTARTDEVFYLSDSVTTITSKVFDGTANLKEVVLTNNVTTIEKNAFTGSSIEFLYIPSSVGFIEFDTFKDCQSLNTVILGEDIKVIGAGAFTGSSVKLVISGNDNLTPVYLPKGEFCYASEYVCSEHIYGYDDKAPTCDEPGYRKCIACLRYEYVKETNHNGAIIESHSATCTEDGYRIVNCIDCGDTRAKAITEKANGHVSNGEVYTFPATFGTPTVKYSTCLVCEEIYVDDYIGNFKILGDVNCDSIVNQRDLELLNQFIASGSVSVSFKEENADLNKDGKIDAEDSKIVSAYLNKEIDELPVRDDIICYDHIVNEETLTIIKRSCREDGFRILYCSDCGHLNREIYTKRFPHEPDPNVPVDVIKPSCQAMGQKIYDCSICKTTIYETLDQLEHERSWYAIDGQRGLEYSSCASCGLLERREVSYAEFEKLLNSLPLICSCRTAKPCADLNSKPVEHLVEAYYTQESYSALVAILNNYTLALSQEVVDQNVEALRLAIRNAKYNVTDVPTIFIEDVPSTQDSGYLETRIIVASLDENGVPKIDAVEYNGEVKIRGRSSSGHSKKPYNIKFSSAINLFGMGAGKKYCLLSNNNDSTLIKNALMFEISHLFGIENSCKYKVVDLYTQGKYYGSYLLTTPVDVGEDRVDIDEDTDFLLEIETSFDTDNGSQDWFEQEEIFSPIFNMRTAVNEPEIQDMSGESLSLLHRYISAIDFAIYSGDEALINEVIDLESVAKYYILHDYLKEIDITWDSTRFYIKDGKLYAGPAWDFDLSMFWSKQNNGEEKYHYYQNLVINGTTYFSEGGEEGDSATGEWASLQWYKNGNAYGSYEIYFRALYLHAPCFMEEVRNQLNELKDEMTLVYTDGVDENGKKVTNVIDSIVNDPRIAESISRDIEKWNKPSQKVDVIALRKWLQARNEWMHSHYNPETNGTPINEAN